METPTPNSECIKIKKPVKKPNNSIELNLKSDKNANYDISIYFFEDNLYFKGISKDQFENKTYEKIYSIEEVKINKYFYFHETIKEVYDELNLLIKNYKDINEIKLLEEKNRLTLIFPLNAIKIKECVFEINEIFTSNNERIEKIMDKLKEIQDKFFEENNLLKIQIKEIKQENIELKEQISQNKIEFQKDLLEKVYPIGSYYWSQKSTSPEELFGGKWQSINGKFLFSTDSNHSVDSEGGEEKHYLTVNEMPSHNHGYDKFNKSGEVFLYNNSSGPTYWVPHQTSYNFLIYYNTSSSGGNQAHNNMPPYITAYCWRRYQ